MLPKKQPDDKQPTLPMTSAAVAPAPAAETPAPPARPETLTVTFEGAALEMIYEERDRLALENRAHHAPTLARTAEWLVMLGADVRALTFIPARFAESDAAPHAPTATATSPEAQPAEPAAAPPEIELTPLQRRSVERREMLQRIFDAIADRFLEGHPLSLTAAEAADAADLPSSGVVAQLFAQERARPTWLNRGPDGRYYKVRVEKGPAESVAGGGQRTVWRLFCEPAFADRLLPEPPIAPDAAPAAPPAVTAEAPPIAPPSPEPAATAAETPAADAIADREPTATAHDPEPEVFRALSASARNDLYDAYLARLCTAVAAQPGRLAEWTVAEITTHAPDAPGNSRKGLGRVLGVMAHKGVTRGGLRAIATGRTRLVDGQHLAVLTLLAV